MTKLCESYRALPSIMDFYSKQFYGSRLKSTICKRSSPEAKSLVQLQAHGFLPQTADKMVRGVPFGAYFIDVDNGKSIQNTGTKSWENKVEAHMVNKNYLMKISSII